MDFKTKKEYIKSHKKIDMEHFNTVGEVTNLIDFINKEIEDKKDKVASDEIHSISQFLARCANRKMFYIKGK